MSEIRSAALADSTRNDAQPEGSRGEDEPVEVSLLSATNFVLRHGRLFILLPLAAAILAIGVTTLLRDDDFVAVSTFLPQGGEQGTSGLAGLASQLGITGARRMRKNCFHLREYFRGRVEQRTRITYFEPVAITVLRACAKCETEHRVISWKVR